MVSLEPFFLHIFSKNIQISLLCNDFLLEELSAYITLIHFDECSKIIDLPQQKCQNKLLS
jgi:hypothetical protein